jgi:hypothetical protein
LRQEIEQALFTVLRTEMAKFRNLREPEVTGSNGQLIADIAELMKEIRVEQETYAKELKGPRRTAGNGRRSKH